jgi:zinc finger protein
VEGILEQVYEELSEKVFTTGDSSITDKEDQLAFKYFLEKLKAVSRMLFLYVPHSTFE